MVKIETVTCILCILPVHNNRRCYKLLREPCNIKDSNAVAIVSGKSGEKKTQQADDVHSNNVTDRCNNQRETGKYL